MGSIPITRSKGLEIAALHVVHLAGNFLSSERAHIAQSVEHFLGKEEVTGSSPVVGSIGHIMSGRLLLAKALSFGAGFIFWS